MPTYDYRCPANGQVVEVRHSMHDAIHNWGELCAAAGIELNGTAADSPVEKLLSASSVVKSNTLGSEPPCKTGPCCGGGGCGH